MAPRKTDKKQKSRFTTVDEAVEMFTTIRMRRWARCPNGLVRELGLPNAWDELNTSHLKPIGLSEAATAHGLEINPKTGALVWEGADVEGTDDATWNKAQVPGAQPPSVRLAILKLRADAIGVRMPASNSMDDFEALIVAAERASIGVKMPTRDRLTIVESAAESNVATEPQPGDAVPQSGAGTAR